MRAEVDRLVSDFAQATSAATGARSRREIRSLIPGELLARSTRHISMIALSSRRAAALTEIFVDVRRSKPHRAQKCCGISSSCSNAPIPLPQAGEIRDRSAEGQHYRIAGMNLLAAIIIFWNTMKLGEVVASQNSEGKLLPPDLLAHVSPLGWEHINLTGEYRWPKRRIPPSPANDRSTAYQINASSTVKIAFDVTNTGSYSAAKKELMPGVEHRSHKGINNRAENSHLAVRR